MVAPELRKKIDARGPGGDRGSWDHMVPHLMAPQLAGLVDYAGGNNQPLAALQKAAKDPEDLAELLTALRPIARGTPDEVKVVEAALAMPTPAVQHAAVALAGAAAQRRDVYQDTLTQALLSADPELRRIAFAAVRSPGDRGRAGAPRAVVRAVGGQQRRRAVGAERREHARRSRRVARAARSREDPAQG